MKRVVSWVGASAASAVVVGVVVAQSGGMAVAADAGAETQSSLVEDFAYPGADAILAEHGLKVISGDGHIEFVEALPALDHVECDEDLIQVDAVIGAGSPEDDPGTEVEDGELPSAVFFCFEMSGARGFLKLEVPRAFQIRAGDVAVRGVARLDGEVLNFTAAPGRYKEVDPNYDPTLAPKGILVELRFGTW